MSYYVETNTLSSVLREDEYARNEFNTLWDLSPSGSGRNPEIDDRNGVDEARSPAGNVPIPVNKRNPVGNARRTLDDSRSPTSDARSLVDNMRNPARVARSAGNNAWNLMANRPSPTSPTNTARNLVETSRSPAGNEQSPESNERGTSPSYLRCPRELRSNICQICREIQIRIHRSITIRGVPRLFLLRRLFCLYWIIVVSLLIYLKLYFPLYLISTVSRNTLQEFRSDWCRVREARTNWKALLSACNENTRWGRHLEGWSEANSTDPNLSYISRMTINPAGDFSRISIQSQTASGQPKSVGGDSWSVHVRGPSALAPAVIDHGNGTYEALFLLMEPGKYWVHVYLDYTLCNGYKDPPDHWFAMEFLSYNGVACGDPCALLWDGFGRWTNGTWAPYVSESTPHDPGPRSREGVLWIYGDSNAVRFYKSIQYRHLCTLIFKRCNFTYNWVYNIHNSTIEKNKRTSRDIDHERILQELKAVLYRPEMNDSKSVLVLNFGLHFVASINFTSYKRLINRTIDVLAETEEDDGIHRRRFQGNVVWKSTSAINRYKLQNPYYQGRRFMTQQRIILFNSYATWAMCRAGIKVLDVYPISNSYPSGTGDRHDGRDAVHYRRNVFDSVISLLERFYGGPEF